MVKAKTLEELNRLFTLSEEVDREVFAEMRSNILLVSGDHYAKGGRGKADVRTSSSTGSNSASSQKLRLIKNHMHRLSRNYVSALLEEQPAVQIRPQIETDLQDQKDAELNAAVWQDISRKHKMKRKTAAWAKDLVDIGEVCTKIFYDPNAGEFKGYASKIDPATDEPMQVPTGEMEVVEDQFGALVEQPVMGVEDDEENPLFAGDFVYETIFAFNLLREPAAQDMHDLGRAWIVRKMIDTKELKDRYKGDPDKQKKIQDGANETYVVFDANKGSYEKVKDQTLLREFYWPVCHAYPRGYFVYCTKTAILEEGELPGGIWPFAWEAFDKYQTTPRGRSIIKVGRPYQAEINRAGSTMGTAQVTLGEDKILYQVGTKLQQGALLPGVRGVSYQGAPPTILPGRDGSQYQPYVDAQIHELEQATMMLEMAGKSDTGQLDPYALLYAAASKKKVYSAYSEKFEDFLVQVATITLELAKIYMPDDAVIPAIGAREAVNIEEFRKTSKLSHQIIIEPGAETLTTQLGKQLSNMHILQYVGKDLPKEAIGKMIQNMPFGNSGDDFEDLTIDSTVAKNTMLALERGKPVQATQYVEPEYMLKKLTARCKTPEHDNFAPEVQAAYQALIQEYEAIKVKQMEALQQAKNEFIPVDGALVTVDMYVNDPTDPEKESRRARLPQRAVEWLMKQLEAQGAGQEALEGMNTTAMADMANMLIQKQGAQGAPQLVR